MLVVEVRGVIEDPIAGADNEPIRTGGPPGDPQARGKLLLVGKDQRLRGAAREAKFGALSGGGNQARSRQRTVLVEVGVGGAGAECVIGGIGKRRDQQAVARSREGRRGGDKGQVVVRLVGCPPAILPANAKVDGKVGTDLEVILSVPVPEPAAPLVGILILDGARGVVRIAEQKIRQVGVA